MALDAAVSVNHFLDAVDRAFRAGDPEAAGKRREQENVRVLQQQYLAIGRNDAAAFAGLLAEDVEFEILGPPEVPFLGRWRGRQLVADTVWRNFSLVEDQRPEICSVVAQGDTVVVVFRERGRVRATGHDYEFECVQVHTFRDGKSVRVRELIVNVG